MRIRQLILHLSLNPPSSGLLTFAMMKVLERQEMVDDPTASCAVRRVRSPEMLFPGTCLHKASKTSKTET